MQIGINPVHDTTFINIIYSSFPVSNSSQEDIQSFQPHLLNKGISAIFTQFYLNSYNAHDQN